MVNNQHIVAYTKVFKSSSTYAGNVKHEVPQTNHEQKTQELSKNAVAAAIGFIALLKIFDTIIILILGFIFITLFPIYTNRVSNSVVDNFGSSLLIGIVTLIVAPIVGLLLFVTILGIPFALLLFVFYVLIIWVSRIFVINAIGQVILTKTKKTTTAWTFLLGVLIYFILTLIPIISFITHVIVTILGVGALIIQKQRYYKELRTKKLI
ncbi:MAG TPA: hypothetical protein VHE53_01550 [Patescibacteria group bacterium]|nr:hypothetical protein [Patescibacteria group bacterium]